MSRWTWLQCILVVGLCLTSMGLVQGQSTQPKKKDKKDHKPHVHPPTPAPHPHPPVHINKGNPRPAPIHSVPNPAPRPYTPPTGPRLTFPTAPSNPPPVATPTASLTPQTLPVGGPYGNNPYGNSYGNNPYGDPNFGPFIATYAPGFNGGMITSSPGFGPMNPFASNPINMGLSAPYSSYGMMDSSNYWGPQRNQGFNSPYPSYGMMDSSNYWGPQRNRGGNRGYGNNWQNPYGQNAFSAMNPMLYGSSNGYYGMANPYGNPYAFNAMSFNPMQQTGTNPYMMMMAMMQSGMLNNFLPMMNNFGMQSAYMGPYPLNNVPTNNFPMNNMGPNWQMQMGGPMGGMGGMGGQVPSAAPSANGIFAGNNPLGGGMQPVAGNNANGAPLFMLNLDQPLNPAALKDQ